MDRVRLKSADVLIMSGLTNAPSANPDTMLGELCSRMGEGGGSERGGRGGKEEGGGKRECFVF